MEDQYYYPQNGEQLGDYQPHLEYKQDNGDWVQSGVTTSLMREAFSGCYRVHKQFLPEAK